MKSLLLPIFFLGISIYVEAKIKCTTPDGLKGRCLKLNACHSLKNLLRKPFQQLTIRDYLLLRYSDCYETEYPHKDMVCCPYEPLTLDIVDPNICKTYDGSIGLCTNLQTCPTFNDKLDQLMNTRIMETIEMSRCENVKRHSVCCGNHISKEQPSINFYEEYNDAPYTTCTMSTTPPDPQSYCCGVQATNGDRIVGGTATAIDEYPWLVLIEYKMIGSNQIEVGCGGSLISGRYVLTAGHCLVGSDIGGRSPVNVRLGEYNLLNTGPDCVITPGGGEDCTDGALVIPIEKIIVHEQYNPNDVNKHNDIALIKLSTMAPYTDFIRPICLPTLDLSVNAQEGLRLFASGWGMTGTLQILNSIKHEVDLPYRRFDNCQEIYRRRTNKTLTRNQMCAGGEPGKDACKGDSGGPLMYKNGELYEVAAVVSFGPTPCGLDIPSVYTHVYNYLPWIWEQINKF
ncbi:PREDICTED: serine protease easter-like [Papilio xuthus]|uniref:CLIP domain-containing serine protease n=1 Tax=Papilio xuthus TaxID=66420 RepID=A0AAJ6ZB59_PAPXU|nr:PREDICTED: serine protease easter-like [Papilio xuthus]